ncbi:hypothetical protein FIBSPDRAFT_936956 [Athelia psychrophila]|uniref:DUF6535 domain-containing protein n=1 Tax=Athelia psychrophila TaxID=1759441 RepID=A0A166B8D1_9AGAM|nr:hypothetical protein FIBSPDRAFT_936956 [Fibularhizoctonia sp. CBS 109695]
MAENPKDSRIDVVQARLAGPQDKSQDKYDDPTAKIWSVYMSEATPHDKALIESWSKDMDGILIFAGLFSAIVTAFILESYAGLMPDPNATTVALLQQISQQLAGNAVQNPTLTSEPFSPTLSALRVNAFWFLSLCLALTCALAATLVQQWARHYTQAIQRRPAPHVQARIRRYLFKGMEKFKMSAVVEGIPTLLHASVFLFFAGLVDFLYQVNLHIAVVTLSIIAACGGLYFFITILPVLYRQSPFRTPLSEPCWAFCRFLGLLRHRRDGKWARLEGSMVEGREFLAGDSNARSTKLAVAGLCWALKNLTEDAELQPFVEGIPAFCTSNEDAVVMEKILLDQDAQLLPRIIALLQTCKHSGSLKPTSRQVRSIACLNALAKLCDFYLHCPWLFVGQHERALRLLVVAVAKESDQQVADAAKSVAAIAVKCIRNLSNTFDDQYFLFVFSISKATMLQEWNALAVGGPDPAKPAQPVHSGEGIPFDQQQQPQVIVMLPPDIMGAEGRGDEELSQPAQKTPGPSQTVTKQNTWGNAPVAHIKVPTVEDGRDGSDDEARTESAEATDPSHTVDPGDDIHLQKQAAEPNATAPPVTAPTVEEERADADLTGSARAAKSLPQRLDSGKHIHFQQQESETSIPRTPATAPKVEVRSSDEGFTASAQAIGGSEAVDSGNNIHTQKPGSTTPSAIRPATAPLVQGGSIDGESEGKGDGKGGSEGYI